jgi:hypothetical protein
MSIIPSPDSLHGRLVAEARTYAPLRAERDPSGRPGYVRVVRKCSGEVVTIGHRDTLAGFGPIDDPTGILARPASD